MENKLKQSDKPYVVLLSLITLGLFIFNLNFILNTEMNLFLTLIFIFFSLVLFSMLTHVCYQNINLWVKEIQNKNKEIEDKKRMLNENNRIIFNQNLFIAKSILNGEEHYIDFDIGKPKFKEYKNG